MTLVNNGVLTQFYEEEISADTSVFGTVAHRLSVCAKSGVQNHGIKLVSPRNLVIRRKAHQRQARSTRVQPVQPRSASSSRSRTTI